MTDPDYEAGETVYYHGQEHVVVEQASEQNVVTNEVESGERWVIGADYLAAAADRGVETVDGVGESRAESLRERGVETVGGLASEEGRAALEAVVGGTRAEKIHERASDRV